MQLLTHSHDDDDDDDDDDDADDGDDDDDDLMSSSILSPTLLCVRAASRGHLARGGRVAWGAAGVRAPARPPSPPPRRCG
eukprot:3688324-Rhodomonas_salina.1